VGAQASGYMLQLVAVDRFCFLHHDAAAAVGAKSYRDNQGVKVEIGFDVASHGNVVSTDLNEAM
jgi:hypothetical protein